MMNLLQTPSKPNHGEREALAATVAETRAEAEPRTERPEHGLAGAQDAAITEPRTTSEVLSAILADASRDSLRYALRSDTWHDGE